MYYAFNYHYGRGVTDTSGSPFGNVEVFMTKRERDAFVREHSTATPMCHYEGRRSMIDYVLTSASHPDWFPAELSVMKTSEIFQMYRKAREREES